MTAPLAIDLCCGAGGWTDGLLAAGYRVLGFDMRRFRGYRGQLVIQDVRTLVGSQFRSARLIVASPPCEQFAVFGMPHFHPNPPYPAVGIELFEATRRICAEAGVPYLIENVRAAQRFVGTAVARCGPFFFWGTAVPALFPEAAHAHRKGLQIPGHEARLIYAQPDRASRLAMRRQFARKYLVYRSSGVRAREAARIPFDLAFHVGSLARGAAS